MTLTQVLYVLEVADCGSISRAAERLYVSQSAISQQILKLEKELGYSLFTRAVYGLELSGSGERFCQLARPVADSWQTLCRDLKTENNAPKKRLRIGVGSRVYSNGLFQELMRFFNAHPEIEVSFFTEAGVDFLKLLRQQSVDLVLDRLPTEDALAKQNEYYTCRLIRERQCLLMSYRDPRASSPALSFSELQDTTVISGLENSAEDRLLRIMCEEYGIHPERIIRSDGIDTNMKLVRNGVGVVLGPQSFARYYNVAAVPLTPEIEVSLQWICRRTLLQRREVCQLRDHLIDCCKRRGMLDEQSEKAGADSELP